MSILACCVLCTSVTQTHALTDIFVTIVNISTMFIDMFKIRIQKMLWVVGEYFRKFQIK